MLKIVFFVLIGLILLFLLLLINIKVQIMMVVSTDPISVVINFSIFKLPIISSKIMLTDNYTVVKDIEKLPFIKLDSIDLKSALMIKKIMSLLKINELIFLVDAGILDDPFTSSMIVSIFQLICVSVFNGLNKKPINYLIKCSPEFNQTYATICFKSQIKISILNILRSVIYANFKTKKLKGDNQHAKAR